MGSSLSLRSPDLSALRPDQERPHLRIHAVNIFVRDQERSLRFYLDQLGFNLAFDARLPTGQRWLAVSPPDGSTVLALIAPERTSKEYKLIGRATQVVFVTDNVAAKFQEWSRRGVRFRHTPRLRRIKYDHVSNAAGSLAPDDEAPIWGAVFTRFEDVDRNSFGLLSFDAVTHALEAHRQSVAAKLEAERRAAQELEIAKQVQARLFPQTLPVMRTLEYAGTCIQARQVGGDYYDFLNLGGDRYGLVIGDIAGKGIAAALLMANLQANLRSQCAIAFDQPQRFLASVNQLFYANTNDSSYATLFFAEYNDTSRRLRYANCGHLAALLLRRDGTIDRLDSTSTVLGLFKEWDCFLSESELFPGDTLVLYTDGVTEAFNEADEEFGERRLIAALRPGENLSSQEVLASVIDAIRRFNPNEQHDDITLIVAKCREAASKPLPAENHGCQ